MTRILSSDLLIVDVITSLAGNAALQVLVDKYTLKPGGKTALTQEQFGEFTAAIEGCPINIMPGGSSANVLVTLSKLIGKEVDITFVGVVGDGLSSNMIRHSMEQANIRLLPETLSEETHPRIAVSYVIVFADGQRTIVTYPGNARDILVPEMITEALVEKNDVVFLQGSLWQKFDGAFAGKLYQLCLAQKKRLWLALPTYSKFAGKGEEPFIHLIQNADLIMGNQEELARLYGMDAEKALLSLQKALLREEQVAFITSDKKGATLVTKKSIESITSAAISPEMIVNTLGAGDTAYAGFAAGYLKKCPHAESVQIAMALAGEKLKINGPRLPDPKAALAAASPALAGKLS